VDVARQDQCQPALYQIVVLMVTTATGALHAPPPLVTYSPSTWSPTSMPGPTVDWARV